MISKRFLSAVALASLTLTACGGGGSSSPQSPPPTPTYSIGGSVSGLQGSSLVLQNNGGNDLSIAADGNFAFTGELRSGAGFNVMVMAQPTGPSQTCTLLNGSGTVGSLDVSNISVECITSSFDIAVTVSGLKGTGLVLQNNGTDGFVVGSDGDYTFSAQVDSGENYDVSVYGEPTDPDQACQLIGASGVVDDTDVVGIEVNCSALAIKEVFAGDWVSCALLENDRVKCWGHNNSGNLGIGDTVPRGTFPGEMGNNLDYLRVGLVEGVVQTDPGGHSCAVLSDGGVQCWGRNSEGQLGIGDTDNRGDDPDEMGVLLPRVDLGGRLATSVGTGSSHSCALLDNNAIKCWGRGLQGALGNGRTVRIGDEPGEMGANLNSIAVGAVGTTAVEVAVGGIHNCAIRNNGSVVCWGLNAFGQLGIGNTEIIGDEPSEMGFFLSPVDLGSGRSALQIVAGNSHTCAILDTGFVKCWGANSVGQLGQGDSEHRGDDANEMGDNLPNILIGGGNLQVDQLAAGTNHTCALLENGRVRCWGSNNRGQLGLGDLSDRGDQANEMGSNLPFVNLGSGRTAVRIAAGATHSCAVLDNGDAKCWGENHFGQLGQDNVSDLGDAIGEMGDDLAAIDIGSE